MPSAAAANGACGKVTEAATLLRDGALLLPDGAERVLAGVYIPPAKADQAQAMLCELLQNPWKFDEIALDRYRRPMGFLEFENGSSLQAALVREGLAYVDVLDLAREDANSLLELEAHARTNRLGVWADVATSEQDARELTLDEPRYAVVRGEVRRVAERSPYLYLDFGEDWRRDFSVRIDLRDVRRLRQDNLDLAALEGRQVRVRGWLFWSYGPMLELVEREQIEVIE